ncbi:Lrp/AsnC family transcriptional regulator [Bowmanella sp. Y26]|uniref:Lrp/AsnC family transcriptional regulator n=1 Tax=Bowmanella yangjiangensis TaxID=2811230 RepID=A0ABS3CV83_9ALTE|nr:Lrp/AsnC family transcriptional regulator [Bowmanella yangjiangensis]MBN7821022.1 Lrp/AsnC family transcriptional regulator [Bowmanella yangjiangensis]MBT1061998.1 Lrp/AsnC family transcriptional regulator [Bowmanella yangjiangensis]
MRPLDNTDLQILALLYKDARLTNKELASRVGLAPSSCLERVKRLQAEQVIQGSSLTLNMSALGGHIQAMIAVRLSNHNRETVDAFMADLLPMPEVMRLYHMGGENDFLVHVTVSDTHHLRDFVFNAVTARAEVNHVETALVYDYCQSQSLPEF